MKHNFFTILPKQAENISPWECLKHRYVFIGILRHNATNASCWRMVLIWEATISCALETMAEQMQRSVGRATRSIEQVQNGKINNLDEGYQFIMSPREST